MKTKILRVVTPNHTFTRYPFAITFAAPDVESFGEDFEFFDESDAARLSAFAKDMGITLDIETKYLPDHMELNGGKLYRQNQGYFAEINEKNFPLR